MRSPPAAFLSSAIAAVLMVAACLLLWPSLQDPGPAASAALVQTCAPPLAMAVAPSPAPGVDAALAVAAALATEPAARTPSRVALKRAAVLAQLAAVDQLLERPHTHPAHDRPPRRVLWPPFDSLVAPAPWRPFAFPLT